MFVVNLSTCIWHQRINIYVISVHPLARAAMARSAFRCAFGFQVLSLAFRQQSSKSQGVPCPTPRPFVVNLCTCIWHHTSMYMWLVFFPYLELQWRSHQHRPGPGVDRADQCRANMAHSTVDCPSAYSKCEPLCRLPFLCAATSGAACINVFLLH